MASLLAIAQMTPGPIAVNTATFVGFQINGVLGAAIATLAVILPAILILIWLAPFVDRISHNLYVLKIRKGIQLGVLSLILYATWSYSAIAIEGWLDLLLGITAFAVLVAFEGKLHPIFVILACGVVGLLFFFKFQLTGNFITIILLSQLALTISSGNRPRTDCPRR